MFPDVTGLLEPEEAFIAIGDDQSVQYEIERHSTHLVAMRLPSYFKGDLRKLKIVSKSELLQRCPKNSVFFNGITVGLILSTKGDRSQAEMMSGGDFDGDAAWCCWDDDIVSHVSECVAADTSLCDPPVDYFKQRPIKWSEPHWSDSIVDFTWHHKYDNKWLSKLCTALNKLRDIPRYGFDKTNEVATKAFLQVDNPFTKQWTDNDERKYGGLPEPHWNVSSNDGYAKKTYRSVKALGELFDLLEEASTKQQQEIEDEMNIHIQRKIFRAEEKNPAEVNRIREEMKNRLIDFNKTMRKKIGSSERNDEVGRRLNNKEISSLYKRHRSEIEALYDVEDRPNAFAILYEQTYFRSINRMLRYNREPYVYAWAVGHDHLTRIIADGEAEIGGGGLAPTVVRGREQLIFGKKR
mmetsp:Transcript_33474/g.73440  ORF Transcript_33474/g.73440 Transcript_33474/m.73440 type:complete len:409 (+) Transcript_33474:1-1227(+)